MDDLISRQAAIDAADRADYTGLAVEDVKKVTDEVVKELKKLPSAQRKGKWVRNNDSDHAWKCSVCGCGYTDYRLNYCYDCGAEMKGKSDDKR